MDLICPELGANVDAGHAREHDIEEDEIVVSSFG